MHALDEFWHRKYVEDERTGRLVPAQAGAANGHDGEAPSGGHGIHLPSPSYWPLVAALGMPMIGYGVLYSWWLVGAGVLVIALIGFYAWAMEPSVSLGGRVAMADVAIERGGDHGADHSETTTGLSHTKLAMWIFLASECMLFGALITTYVLYRGRSLVGPYPGRRLRHPVHVGVVVRAARQLADDGACAVCRATGRRGQDASVAAHDGVARV